MAWRLHDYIHLNLTNIRLSDLQSYENPLKMLDALVDENKQIRIITFSPQTYVVWEDFEQIVRKDNRCVATFKQVKEFVETCFKDHYEKTTEYFDIDEMIASVYDINTSDDTIIIIEFED